MIDIVLESLRDLCALAGLLEMDCRDTYLRDCLE